jgi:hypothetical protein
LTSCGMRSGAQLSGSPKTLIEERMEPRARDRRSVVRQCRALVRARQWEADPQVLMGPAGVASGLALGTEPEALGMHPLRKRGRRHHQSSKFIKDSSHFWLP